LWLAGGEQFLLAEHGLDDGDDARRDLQPVPLLHEGGHVLGGPVSKLCKRQANGLDLLHLYWSSWVGDDVLERAR
jgi:hypothetical protein